MIAQIYEKSVLHFTCELKKGKEKLLQSNHIKSLRSQTTLIPGFYV